MGSEAQSIIQPSSSEHAFGEAKSGIVRSFVTTLVVYIHVYSGLAVYWVALLSMFEN